MWPLHSKDIVIRLFLSFYSLVKNYCYKNGTFLLPAIFVVFDPTLGGIWKGHWVRCNTFWNTHLIRNGLREYNIISIQCVRKQAGQIVTNNNRQWIEQVAVSFSHTEVDGIVCTDPPTIQTSSRGFSDARFALNIASKPNDRPVLTIYHNRLRKLNTRSICT